MDLLDRKAVALWKIATTLRTRCSPLDPHYAELQHMAEGVDAVAIRVGGWPDYERYSRLDALIDAPFTQGDLEALFDPPEPTP